VQPLAVELPAGEEACSGHATHLATLVAPLHGEYVSAGQSTQSPPVPEYIPSLQAQADCDVVPALETVPGGHAVHPATLVAPLDGEYVFAGQSKQPGSPSQSYPK
jgi:hypothetical protein